MNAIRCTIDRQRARRKAQNDAARKTRIRFAIATIAIIIFYWGLFKWWDFQYERFEKPMFDAEVNRVHQLDKLDPPVLYLEHHN